MSDLGSVIIGDPDAHARTPEWREGVVTQVSPLLVRVGSAVTATPANALSSYAPHVGDAVSVLVLSGDRLVLGTVAATSGVALGVIARAPIPGSPLPIPAGGAWYANPQILSCVLQTGRRYRIVFNSRAWGPNSVTDAVLRIGMWDGAWTGDPVSAGFDHYQNGRTTWGGFNVSILKDGNGVNHDFTMALSCGVDATVYPTEFYIEDIGPAR